MTAVAITNQPTSIHEQIRAELRKDVDLPEYILLPLELAEQYGNELQIDDFADIGFNVNVAFADVPKILFGYTNDDVKPVGYWRFVFGQTFWILRETFNAVVYMVGLFVVLTVLAAGWFMK